MNHGVTVWADRPKVVEWIHTILAPNVRQRPQMVDVNQSLACGPVSGLEVEAADEALVTESLDTTLARDRVALVGVHGDGLGGALPQDISVSDFIWELKGDSALGSTEHVGADAALVTLSTGPRLGLGQVRQHVIRYAISVIARFTAWLWCSAATRVCIALSVGANRTLVSARSSLRFGQTRDEIVWS